MHARYNSCTISACAVQFMHNKCMRGMQKKLLMQNLSQKSENWYCICFRTLRIIYDKKNCHYNFLRILSNLISKNKNQKIFFHRFSAHCASFLPIWPSLRGGGGDLRMSLTRNNTIFRLKFKTVINQSNHSKFRRS